MQGLAFDDKLKLEAMERLALMKATPLSRIKILDDWKITKSVVDFETERITYSEPTEEELEMIKKYEEKYNQKVYYVIQDTGRWPDGCTFPRYTFLCFSKNDEDWNYGKAECIIKCKTVPAYVINMEELNCSEFAEIGFECVEGILINVT